jgi:cytidyltransferase-like protein
MPKAVFIGRMNPPTVGHIRGIQYCEKQLGMDVVVGVSDRKEPEQDFKNPFTWLERVRMLGKAMPNNRITKVSGFHVDELMERYPDAVICVGEDQRPVMENMQKYVQFPYYIIPRGDGDASSTKVKEAVLENDRDTFIKMMPDTLYDEFNFIKERINELTSG